MEQVIKGVEHMTQNQAALAIHAAAGMEEGEQIRTGDTFQHATNADHFEGHVQAYVPHAAAGVQSDATVTLITERRSNPTDC